MRVAGLVAALMLNACAAQADAPRAPDWMSGYWLWCEGAEIAESWIGAGSPSMLGTNLSGEGFEFLRIADNGRGGLSYFSMPNGRSPATEFTMTEHDGQRVVFANPEHDFPQRVIYARTGDVLTARIEGEMNGHEEFVEWEFHRAAQDTRCPS